MKTGNTGSEFNLKPPLFDLFSISFTKDYSMSILLSREEARRETTPNDFASFLVHNLVYFDTFTQP